MNDPKHKTIIQIKKKQKHFFLTLNRPFICISFFPSSQSKNKNFVWVKKIKGRGDDDDVADDLFKLSA